MKNATHTLLLATLIGSAAPVFAGDFYLVGSLGQSRLLYPKSGLDAELIADGATNINSTFDTKDTAYKLLFGYQFNPHLGIEGGYVDLSKTKYTVSATQGNGTLVWKAKGLLASAVGTLPINDSFGVFAKLTAFRSEVAWTASATGTLDFNESWSGAKWKAAYGVGAAYNLNKKIGLRLEYERFDKLGDVNSDNVELVSAGVVYKF